MNRKQKRKRCARLRQQQATRTAELRLVDYGGNGGGYYDPEADFREFSEDAARRRAYAAKLVRWYTALVVLMWGGFVILSSGATNEKHWARWVLASAPLVVLTTHLAWLNYRRTRQ